MAKRSMEYASDHTESGGDPVAHEAEALHLRTGKITGDSDACCKYNTNTSGKKENGRSDTITLLVIMPYLGEITSASIIKKDPRKIPKSRPPPRANHKKWTP